MPILKKPTYILLLRRTHLAALAVLLLAAAIFAVVYAPTAVTTGAVARQLPIYSVERQDKCVAISFDAAWGDVRVR